MKSNSGSVLTRMREERGMTQMELAALIGVSHSRVSRYEHGRALPSFSVFRSMRETFGVTADALMEAFDDAARRARRNGRSAA